MNTRQALHLQSCTTSPKDIYIFKSVGTMVEKIETSKGHRSMASRLPWKIPLGRGQESQSLLCARAAGYLGEI